MHRHDHWRFVTDRLEGRENRLQALRIIRVGSAMDGDQYVSLRCDTSLGKDRAFRLGAGTVLQDRIVHHVTNQVDTAGRDAFTPEIVDGRLGGNEMHRGDMIDNDAVDFLRHGTITRAQAGLDVGDRDIELGRGKRARERRIGIAVNQHAGRPAVD